MFFSKKPEVKPGQIAVTKKNAILVVVQQLSMIINLLRSIDEKLTKKK